MADINIRSAGLVDNLNQFRYHILGCGAIGSSAALQLARMGAEEFALYDMDDVETANIGVSQYTGHDIGYPKVTCLKSHILDISTSIEVTCLNNIFENYIYLDDNDIIILGFDSMDARLQAVKALSFYKHSKPFLLIDGRMGAEHFQQYIIKHPTIAKYEKIWYSDEEGSPEPCTAKATSYCSNLAGSFIVNGIRKLITNQPYNSEFSINLPTLVVEKSKLIS